jgi:hypothetical protein
LGLTLLVYACGSDAQLRTDGGDSDSGPTPSSESPTLDEIRRVAQAEFGTDLSISLLGPREVSEGERAQLTLAISNHGPNMPLDYYADVELSSQLSFLGSSANCQEYRPPGGISCSGLPHLSVGDAIAVTIDVDVTGRSTDGTLEVDARVYPAETWDVVDTGTDNDTTQLRMTVLPSR